ncbi:MAG TPA: hypothetical protein DD381_00465 [Lentisphaeria bacterium]|nr:MAG: hypothetical protein A2X47_05070 [Lentisphaerae bacterium GWF2_38_69]HBM14815.1 hypothetical protein [Lentisphaeria bacterium]
MRVKIKVSDIVFMNIVTLLGIRWFATAAQYGPASVILWGLASLLYFVPMSFIFAEFGSVFSEYKGGLVDWIRCVYGEKTAFISGWFYLICNIFYFPTILTFGAVTVAYVIDPALTDNKLFITSFVIIFFWVGTIINIKGVKWIAFVGKYGGLLGNIIPIIVALILAVILVAVFRNPVPTDFSAVKWIPDFDSANLLFLATLTFAMSGGEITSPFVADLKNPRKDFAKATLISAAVITLCYIIGTIAFTLILNPSEIGAASGPIDVIAQASKKVHIAWFADIIAVMIVISSIAGAIIWMVGNVRMFIDGNDDKYIGKFLKKQNINEIPSNALILQSLVVTLIVLATSLMKSVENIYIALIVMATIPMFIVYLILIFAFLKLKFKMQKDGKFMGSYSAPWGKAGALVFFLIAGISTLATIIIPIFSPGDNNVFIYEAEVIGGPIIFLVIALLIMKRANKKTS